MAESLKEETALGSVTPARVGTIMSDTLRYINEAQIFADSLVHKIYSSEEAFIADTEHLSDLTGKPMKVGCLIYIESAGAFFRYDGPSAKTKLSGGLFEVIEEQAKKVVEINHSSLLALRENGELVAGRLYRITDYITTTSQTDTQSAGHPFDVIVLALSESEISEQAWAIQSERDTDGYFANSKLSAWKIWYRLDNDTSSFVWADATNGKGVIYRMIDEHGNDCPYDFKNIQFKHPNNTTDTTYYYTFSTVLSGVVTDHSFNGGYCYGNKIGIRIADGKQQLNVIVFINKSNTAICISNSFGDSCRNNSFGTACYSNTFGNNCHSNSFQDNCRFNSFGDACYSNIFDKSCYGNSFGNYCYSNTFGESCRYNSFENGCYSNTFGESYRNNSFGNTCYSNTFGKSCYYNSLGNDCHSNRFGDTCTSNSLGNTCYSNTFANLCDGNSFGNTCNFNTLGSSCRYNSFGNKSSRNSLGSTCSNNSFGNDTYANNLDGNCHSNSFGNSCSHNRFGTYYVYNKVDDDVSSIILSNSQTAASNQQVKNYYLTQGLRSLTIEVERNRDYQTTIALDSSGNIKQFCIADIIQ